MKQKFTYQLPEESKKYKCPMCGKRTFKKYINIYTKEYLHDSVGRCERINNCKYHYSPKQFFADFPGCNTVQDCYSVTAVTTVTHVTHVTDVTLQPIQYLAFEHLDKSVIQHWKCNLYPYLAGLFSKDVASCLCLDYFIGTNRNRNTVFWQVDIKGNIRQAKVICYDPSSGHRRKETVIYFIGKQINGEGNYQQCFFGEYLLSDENNKHKPVAIVESEKTAVIASLYMPSHIWLATGGKNGCKWTEQKVCSVLKGRSVVLYPDLGAYDEWKRKASLLASIIGCKVEVSDLLEKNATPAQRKQGLDLADFLIVRDDVFGWALIDGAPTFWGLKITATW